MRALILVSPRCPPCQRRARQLEDELRWRNFDARIETADARGGYDVSNDDLVVLVFPALVLPGLSLPLGGIRAALDGLRGIGDTPLALLAISPLGLRAPLHRFAAQVERRFGRVVAIRTTPPAGSRRSVIDLAAECMARVTGR